MLYGSASEGWGSECQITELHNAATEAKRNYENLAKVNPPQPVCQADCCKIEHLQRASMDQHAFGCWE